MIERDSTGLESRPPVFSLQLSKMSQQKFPATPAQPAAGQPAMTFPYGTYHPPPGAYGQATGATPYTWPTTGVTGYGTWPGYAYNYAPSTQKTHIQSGAQTSRPIIQTAGMQAAASTPTPGSATPRTTTFSSYTPSYLRESVAAAGSGGATGRGSRKQANFKGMFSKECMLPKYCISFSPQHFPRSEELDVWIWG